MIGYLGRSFFRRIFPEIQQELGNISSQAKESELVLREQANGNIHFGNEVSSANNDKEYYDDKQHSTILNQIADNSYDEEVKFCLLSLNL
jgi:hypothetical protein